MFQPVVPLSGIGGWNFLQATYDRQLASFSDGAAVRGDRDYMVEKLSQPLSVEALLDDRRLLRTVMTAFDLGGEEWKRGFIDKALSEAGDSDSTFLTRLNNPQYTRFAEALAPRDGQISLTASAVTDLAEKFTSSAFKSAVGEVDNDMRLALNFQTEIGELVGTGSSDEAVMFRILGSVPVRTVLESALNLPSDVRQLPIEKQADLFGERLSSRFGISDLSSLTDPDNMNRIITQFHAIQSLNNPSADFSPASTALTLLSQIGSAGRQNLFLGGLL